MKWTTYSTTCDSGSVKGIHVTDKEVRDSEQMASRASHSEKWKDKLEQWSRYDNIEIQIIAFNKGMKADLQLFYKWGNSS